VGGLLGFACMGGLGAREEEEEEEGVRPGVALVCILRVRVGGWVGAWLWAMKNKRRR